MRKQEESKSNKREQKGETSRVGLREKGKGTEKKRVTTINMKKERKEN